MSRLAGVLLMSSALASGALASGCGPSGGATPAQLWLARGTDELHAQLVDTGPPAPY